MGIFNKLDTLLIAGFQWIVNKTGRKPRWFCKQMCILLVMAALFRPFETHDLGWVVWVGVLINLVLASSLALMAWFAPDEALKREHPFWRWTWTFLAIIELVVPPTSPSRTAVMISISLYFCFASCDNPPPPRKRKEEKKATIPPLFGTLSPSINPTQG